jgi:hypothetical protein
LRLGRRIGDIARQGLCIPNLAIEVERNSTRKPSTLQSLEYRGERLAKQKQAKDSDGRPCQSSEILKNESCYVHRSPLVSLGIPEFRASRISSPDGSPKEPGVTGLQVFEVVPAVRIASSMRE